MKVGDLIKWQEKHAHTEQTRKDIGLIVKTFSFKVETLLEPMDFISIIWQRDGFKQDFSVDIANDRIEVINGAQV